MIFQRLGALLVLGEQGYLLRQSLFDPGELDLQGLARVFGEAARRQIRCRHGFQFIQLLAQPAGLGARVLDFSGAGRHGAAAAGQFLLQRLDLAMEREFAGAHRLLAFGQCPLAHRDFAAQGGDFASRLLQRHNAPRPSFPFGQLNA